MNNKRQEKRNNRNRRKTKAKKSTGKKILIGILIVLLLGIAWFTYRTYKNGWGLSGMLATVVGHDENTKKNYSGFTAIHNHSGGQLYRLYGKANTARKHDFGGAV